MWDDGGCGYFARTNFLWLSWAGQGIGGEGRAGPPTSTKTFEMSHAHEAAVSVSITELHM